MKDKDNELLESMIDEQEEVFETEIQEEETMISETQEKEEKQENETEQQILEIENSEEQEIYYHEVIYNLENINDRLHNFELVSISILIALGLLVGGVLATILSNYFKGV